jgi:hypothetical protein
VDIAVWGKSPFWREFTVRTQGARGAYTHATKSAAAIAAKVIGAREALENIPVPEASNLAAALDQAAAVVDRAQGVGASKIAGGSRSIRVSCAALKPTWSRPTAPSRSTISSR